MSQNNHCETLEVIEELIAAKLGNVFAFNPAVDREDAVCEIVNQVMPRGTKLLDALYCKRGQEILKNTAVGRPFTIRENISIQVREELERFAYACFDGLVAAAEDQAA